jgi:hypothetical protein
MNQNQLRDDTKPRSVDQQQACSPAELSHSELIRLIGEIDGIDLEGHGGRLFVNLRIGGKNIELISDSGENPLHHITREGIRAVLSQANIVEQKQK